MRRSLLAVVLGALAGVAMAATPVGPPVWSQDNGFGGLPEGEHRQLVFGICSGCHSVKLVMQQSMSRAKWNSTLDWMTEKQGMPALDSNTEQKVLDYLAAHFGPDHRDGGRQQDTDGGDSGGRLNPYNTMQPMSSPK